MLSDPIRTALDGRRKEAISALRFFVDMLDRLTEEEKAAYVNDRTTGELEQCGLMIFGRSERLL